VFRPKHVEQLRNTGIINSTTQLHLVGSFYEIIFPFGGVFYLQTAGAIRRKYSKGCFINYFDV
jgi:hypothetical protein